MSALPIAALVGSLAIASGCAETTVIRSTPPGAKVSINGTSLGATPAEFSVDRYQFQEPYNYRIELPGYVSRQGTLGVKVQPARAVGIVLTYGVLAAFKKPSTFEDEYAFRLEPSACTTAQEDAIRGAGLAQTSVDVVCAYGYPGPPRVIAPIECRAEQMQTMKASGLSDEQARRACGR